MGKVIYFATFFLLLLYSKKSAWMEKDCAKWNSEFFVVPSGEFPTSNENTLFRYCIAGKGSVFMLLSTVKDEFVSIARAGIYRLKTTKNYRKQIEYL